MDRKDDSPLVVFTYQRGSFILYSILYSCIQLCGKAHNNSLSPTAVWVNIHQNLAVQRYGRTCGTGRFPSSPLPLRLHPLRRRGGGGRRRRRPRIQICGQQAFAARKDPPQDSVQKP